MALAVTPGTGATLKSSLSGSDHVVHHNVDTLPPITGTGVLATQENGPALTALQLIDDAIAILGAAIGATKGMLAAGTDGTAVRAVAVTAAGLVKVDDGGGSLTVDDGGSTLSIDDGGSSVSIDDNGSSLTIDGSVGIIGTVPVSGPATDAQLRATPLPVSGNLGITGSVAVTGPLTDAQIRAAALAVAEGGAALTALQLIDDMIVAQAAAISAAKVALLGGSDGTVARALKVSTAGLLQIDSLPAGTALIGRADMSIGGTAVSASARVPVASPPVISLTPPMGTQQSGAYVANRFVDGKITLANIVPVAGGSGVIQTVKIHSKTPFGSVFWVALFHTDPAGTTFGDNTNFSIADADGPRMIGMVKLDQMFSLTAGSWHQATNLALPFKLPSGTSAWAAIATVGAITTTSASDIILMLDVLPDYS
jgi:hypothetical protein